MTTNSKRALASQEREQQMQRLSVMSRSLLLAFALLISLGTVVLLLADRLYQPDEFVIEQLKIKGKLRHLTHQQVEEVVKSELDGNFFSVSLSSIEQKIEKMSWVADASVRREWPNTLLIEVKEQRLVARWGDNAWLNQNAEVVELANVNAKPTTLNLFGHPRDAERIWSQSKLWRAALKKHNLSLQKTRLSESNAYRITVLSTPNKFSTEPNSFEILLGSEDVDLRLQRFLLLYSAQLSKQAIRIQKVDARYPNGLAIRQQQISIDDSQSDV